MPLVDLRAIPRYLGNTVARALASNENDELLATPGNMPYQELSRQGGGWHVMNTGAHAALVVRPSTTSNFTLLNNYPQISGLCLVIDRIFGFNLVSTAAEARAGMWVCVHPPGRLSTTLGADITLINGYTGKSKTIASGQPNEQTKDAFTVTDDGWYPIGPFSTVEPTGVLPGAIMEARAEGRFIIPPGGGFSGQIVASVAGDTYTMGFGYYVKKVTLE